MFSPQDHPVGFLAVLAGIGAAVGLGKLLASNEPLTARVVIGRTLVAGGVGAAAGATTLLFPSADPIVLLGVSAALSSVSVSVFELVIQKWLGGKSGT